MATTQTKTRIDEEVYLTSEVEQDLQDRLSRIEGHVRGVKRMLAEHRDCESLLIQMAAIKAAVNQVTIKLLEEHMDTCVADCVAKGDVEALHRLKRALATVLKNV